MSGAKSGTGRAIGWVSLTVGIVLLVLNGYGLAAPPRPPDDVRRFEIPPRDEDLRSTPLTKLSDESDEEYFRRATMALHYRIHHEWPVGPAPLRDNYVLNLLQYVVPSYRNYEYIDHERAIQRGIGICTQYSLALFDILKEEGFERRIIQLPRHTFVEATTSAGTKMILDANYGVVMPYSWDEVSHDTRVVRPYYESLDPSNRPRPDRSPREIGQVLQEALSDDPIAIQVDAPTEQTYLIEPIAYLVKWLGPVSLMVIAAGLLFRRRS